MSMYRKLMTFGCAAVLALGLAACGGGGDDDTAQTPAVTDPPAPSQEDLDAANERADAAEKELADKEAAEAAAALTKTAKALKKALVDGDMQPLDYAFTPTGLTPAGLVATVNDDRDDGTTAVVTLPRMATGDAVEALGDWAGTDYAHTDAVTKVSNSARIYNNRAEPRMYPIASRYAVDANNPLGAGTYTAATRTLNVGTAADSNIKADMFPTSGETNFTPTAPSNEVLVPGTYQGAEGDYRCTGTCTATATATGVQLSDAWVFVHDVDAMVSVVDPSYLYFGWWLQKDKGGEPTMASAFTGVGGAAIAALASNPNALGGSATYTGAAAGKFAISDPLNAADDDAGHFTADVTLTAVFSANTPAVAGATPGGVSGTLDNFMANEEAVPWSVTLRRAGWDDATNGAFAMGTAGTVWSIDGNAAAMSGSWSGQMYDERPGNAPSGDGSNVPTSATGTFQSHFGSTHSMVGAFGATKE